MYVFIFIKIAVNYFYFSIIYLILCSAEFKIIIILVYNSCVYIIHFFEINKNSKYVSKVAIPPIKINNRKYILTLEKVYYSKEMY